MADDLNVRRGDMFFSSDDEGDDKPARAIRYVLNYYNGCVGEGREGFDEFLKVDDVYVVLFAYVLGSWKAHVSTTVPDGRYYEVTFNRDKGEVYIDEYKKQANTRIVMDN